MQTPDDMSLVREFAGHQNEAAFETLVARHVNLVYSAALRQTGDAHLAEEITQAVFLVLARKAGSLRRETFLTGWLFKTTRFAAAAERRARIRRLHRETQAYMNTSQITEAEAWPQIAPLLDEALASLGETDRRAVLLRYFENKPLAEVGAALGVNEEAARKRVTRGLEKLRKLFGKRGVTLTAAAIASVVATNSVQAAPVGLVATVAATTAKGVVISATLTTLVKGTMKTITWMKIKLAVGVSVAVLLVGGTVTVALSGDKPQQVPVDTVTFFKQAISSPSDVDSFIAGQRSLRPIEDLAQLAQLLAPRPNVENRLNPQESLQKAKQMQLEQFYAGARAGSDYYLRYISSPSTPKIPAENESIIGRAGVVLYQVGKDNVSYGSGTNAFVASVDSMFGLVRQFLDLGLGDVEPESVVWKGNEFTALNQLGKSRYGELEISNSLPFAVNISEQKNSPVIKRVEYQYPNPPASLGGFPTKMTILTLSEGEYKPNLEINLYSVHIADGRLPHGFFSDDRFKTAKTIYTNAYINSEVWGIIKPLKGKPYFTNLSNIKIVYPKNRNNAK